MDLGTRIAAWRRAKGYSQTQLAEKIGVTVAAVSYWEGGEKQTSPTHEHLEAVVAALGITMERFYGRIPAAKKAS